DSLGGTFKRAAGVVSVLRTDTSFNADGGVIQTTATVPLGTLSSFKNGSPRETFTISITRATAGLTAADSMQTLLITVESSDAATTPGDVKVLWARRGDGSAVLPDTGVVATRPRFRNSAIRMGNFGPLAISQYAFTPTIRGRGAFEGPLL